MEWPEWHEEHQILLPFDVEFEGHPPEIVQEEDAKSSPPPLGPIKALSKFLGERRLFSSCKLLFDDSSEFLPPLPGFHINGVGFVRFPLTGIQAETLKSFAFRSVRDQNIYRIDGKLVQMNNPDFAAGLETIKRQIAIHIGCPDIPLKLHLLEMMIMEANSMFAPREGFKKSDQVFGWLFVQLSSKHIGGELHITWKCLDDTQQEFVLDLGAKTEKMAFHTRFAFFFNKAEYTFTPVTDGIAMFLMYTVALPPDVPILALPNAEDKERLMNLLRGLLDTKESAFLFLLGEYPREAVAARGADALSGIDHERVMFLTAANEALDLRFALALTYASRKTIVTGRRTENDGINWTRENETLIVYGQFWQQLNGELTNIIPKMNPENPSNLLNPDELTPSKLWGDKGVHHFKESTDEDTDVVVVTTYTRLVLILQPETSSRDLTFDNIFTIEPTRSELRTLLENHRRVANRFDDGPKAAAVLSYIVHAHLNTLFPLFLATFEATAFEDVDMDNAWILFFKSPMWRGTKQLFMDNLKRHARVAERALHLAVITVHKGVPQSIFRALLQIVLDNISEDHLDDPRFIRQLWRTVLLDGSKNKIELLRLKCLHSLVGQQLKLVLNAILAPDMHAAFLQHKASLQPILERRSEWLRTKIDSMNLPDGWDADMPLVFLPGQEKTEALLRDPNHGLELTVHIPGYQSDTSADNYIASKVHLDKFLRMTIESKERNHTVVINKTPELVVWQKRKRFIDELATLESYSQSPAEKKAPKPARKKIKTEGKR